MCQRLISWDLIDDNFLVTFGLGKIQTTLFLLYWLSQYTIFTFLTSYAYPNLYKSWILKQPKENK